MSDEATRVGLNELRSNEAAAPAKRSRDWSMELARYGTIIALVLLFAGFSLARPDVFATRFNLLSILGEASILVIVSVGLTTCLIMGLYDLSISAVATVGNYMICSLLVMQGDPPYLWLTIAAVIGMCTIVGVVNGAIVSYLGVSAFIATLAMGSILTGVMIGYSNMKTIVVGIPDNFLALGQESSFGIPNPVLIMLAIVAFLWLLLEHTQIGRNLYAIGGSVEGAKLSGIAVKRYALLALGISGVCAGIGGMIAAANLSAGRPTGVGDAYLLNAFAASFVGASTLRPGQFHILGTVVGVLIIAVMSNGLSVLGVQTYWQYIVQGVLLLVAMFGAGAISNRKA